MYINLLLPLLASLLVFSSLNGEVTLVFGNSGASNVNGGNPQADNAGNTTDVTEIMGPIAGIQGRASPAEMNTALAGTSLSSDWTSGSLSTVNDENAVTFDLVFATYGDNDINDQRDGIGLHTGATNVGIDNYYVTTTLANGNTTSSNNSDASLTNNEANLEWISMKLDNVQGLAAGESLVFKQLDILFGSGSNQNGEYYRLDVGGFGSAPDASLNTKFANVVANISSHTINNSQFTIGSGVKTDGTDFINSFVLNSVTIDVVPEVSSFGLFTGLAAIGFIALRRRI